ncbi:MAG: glycosyltransferase [Caldilineaceae bacterium]
MRKVLVIAHAFPPIGGIGVQRILKFTKYLPQFGWQPVILTVKHSDSFIRDESLTEELPKTTLVYRTRSWEPFNATRVKQATERIGGAASANAGKSLKSQAVAVLRPLYFALRIPDDKVGWWPFATRMGRKLMADEAIDLIFATAPPYTNFLVAQALKRATGKPMVIDYRDEWSSMRYQDYPTNPVTDFLNRRLERSVLQSANTVITATPGIGANLKQANLLAPTTALKNIFNGFDPDDYQVEAPLPKEDRLTFVYTGTLYGERRTPKYFVQALAKLFQAKPELRTKIRVHLVGTIYEKHAQLIPEYGVEDVVHLAGVVSHQQAIAYQLAADVLLLIVGNGPGSEAVLTGKLFEYFGAGRPILALAPLDGPAAKLIQETATGEILDSEDVDGICRTVDQLYQAWVAGKLCYQPNQALLDQFSRPALTAQLAQLFDQLTGK